MGCCVTCPWSLRRMTFHAKDDRAAGLLSRWAEALGRRRRTAPIWNKPKHPKLNEFMNFYRLVNDWATVDVEGLRVMRLTLSCYSWRRHLETRLWLGIWSRGCWRCRRCPGSTAKSQLKAWPCWGNGLKKQTKHLKACKGFLSDFLNSCRRVNAPMTLVL